MANEKYGDGNGREKDSRIDIEIGGRIRDSTKK